MTEPASLAGSWTFSRPARAGRERLEAEAALRDGRLRVSVPGFGAAGLILDLALEGGELAGTFQVGESGRGSVRFALRDEGRTLVGTPAGFASRERWTLRREVGGKVGTPTNFLGDQVAGSGT